MKKCKACFARSNVAKLGTPFRTDRKIDGEIYNARPFLSAILDKLNDSCGKLGSNCGSVLHAPASSRPDLSYSMDRLGYFIIIPCQLGCVLLCEVFFYLYTRLNKPLIFQKSLTDANRTTQTRWSANKSI